MTRSGTSPGQQAAMLTDLSSAAAIGGRDAAYPRLPQWLRAY
ncbi:hypothetical protein [Mycobacteroides chelonae]|nr:hypothetical protein [Mycobacteroides chelonae]